VCKCTSLISQYRRRVIQMLISHHDEKLRHAICVARLTLEDCLSYFGTSRRRMFSEARLRLSYTLSEFLQATGCILELTRILLPVKTHRGAVSQQHKEPGSPRCHRWSPVTSELWPAWLAHTRRDGSRACHLVCTCLGRWWCVSVLFLCSKTR
jgi:hypothetical protein